VDTVSFGTSLRSSYTITQESDGAVNVDSVSGASDILHAKFYNLEKLIFDSEKDLIDLSTYFQTTANINGTDQDDLLSVSTSSANVDGLAGTDTLVLGVAANSFRLETSVAGFNLLHQDGSGTLSLTNVERLNFVDQKLALDLTGNAGSVAKIIGAVFGAGAVARPDFVGIGLSLLDSGQYNTITLMDFALEVALGPKASPEAVVDLLYFNVVGVLPDAQTQQSFVDMILNGTYTAATLGDMAANTDINQANIQLTGLLQTGLIYS
jgi:hypothetical protein